MYSFQDYVKTVSSKVGSGLGLGVSYEPVSTDESEQNFPHYQKESSFSNSKSPAVSGMGGSMGDYYQSKAENKKNNSFQWQIETESYSKHNNTYNKRKNDIWFTVLRAKTLYTGEDMTGEDYAIIEPEELEISFSQQKFHAYSLKTQREVSYNYKDIKKINHKRSDDGNFLNIILAQDSIAICTPDSVKLKATLIDHIKKYSSLKITDYHSNY